jgi:hypothetical protein
MTLFSFCLIGFLATSFPGWIMSWSLKKEYLFSRIFYYCYPIILIFTIIHIIKGGE